jgi:hypothetical protein
MTKPDVLVSPMLASTIEYYREFDGDGSIAAEMLCRGWTRAQVARGFAIADRRAARQRDQQEIHRRDCERQTCDGCPARHDARTSCTR